MVGTITAAFTGTKVKLISSANAVDVTGFCASLPGDGPQIGGGIDPPIFQCGANAVDLFGNMLLGTFIEGFAIGNTAFAPSAESVSAAGVIVNGFGFPTFAKGLFSVQYPCTINGANVDVTIGQFIPNGVLNGLPALSTASPSWIAANTNLAFGPYTYNGTLYLVVGTDGTPSGAALLANANSIVIANIWNAPEFNTGPQAIWTNGTDNYILAGLPNGVGYRYYIVHTDASGNEISRNYIKIADPNYDQWLSLPNVSAPLSEFFTNAQGFGFTIPPGYDNAPTERKLLFLSADGSQYAIYVMEALDAGAAAALNITDNTGTLSWGNPGFGGTAYLDGEDRIWITPWAPNLTTQYLIYLSVDYQAGTSIVLSQPLGACWPCALTATGTH
jgi:hypothetical protein